MNAHSSDIIVAFDGAYPSTAALDWAAEEAGGCGCGVTVLSVVPPAGRGLEGVDADEGDRLHSAAIRRVTDRWPRLAVRTLLAATPDDPALAPALAAARLVVLGGRGRTGTGALTLGSTSEQLVRRIACPVVVVPEQAWVGSRTPPLVVLGLDRRHVAGNALEFALSAAAVRGGDLEVLYAADDRYRAHTDPGGAGARRLWVALLDDLEPLVLDRPEVTVSPVITPASLLDALVSRSHEADLIVLSSTGVLSLAGLERGSCERDVMRGSFAPVALVPKPEIAHPGRRGRVSYAGAVGKQKVSPVSG